jgi:hypothetical protein
MTTNVKWGNYCQFVAEFLDQYNNITIPPAATLTLSYPTGLTYTSTSIAMLLSQSFYTATWWSSVSDLGAVTWNISSFGSTQSTQGDLRVITP